MVSVVSPSSSNVQTTAPPVVVPVGAMPERGLRDLVRELPASARRIWPAWAMLATCVAVSLAMLALLAVVAAREGVSTDIVHFVIWGPLFSANVVTGLLILHRYPGHRVGWTLCLAGFTWVTANAFWCYGAIAFNHTSLRLPAADVVTQIGFYYPFGLALILVELLLIFPSGRLAAGSWWVVRWIGLLGALGASLEIGFGNRLVMNGEFGEIANPWRAPGVAGTAMESAGIGFMLIFPMGIAAGVSMVRRLRRSTGVERAQLRWIAWDTVALVIGFVAHFVSINLTGGQGWYWIVGLAWGLVLNSFAVATGLAILRYRLFDIDFVIHRSVLYGVLVGVIAALALALVNLLGVIAQGFGGELSPWVTSLVVAAGVVLVVHPLRTWLEGQVNRRLYGERDDPGAVLARLGARLEAAVAPADLLGEVTRTVTDLLRLPHAAVALRSGEALMVVAETGDPGPEQVGVPMVYQHESIGELRVTPRGPGDGFSRADSTVLEGIARQTAVAAYALRVTGDLRQARERLVTAREEERRRLRRDLHDGLGAQLAALAMQVNGARRLVRADPAGTERELDALHGELRSAIADIRRLVHGLRPPALDEFGLVAALRSRLLAFEAASGGITTELRASGDDRALSAAVEVAIYRIVEEALTNVARHADARRVRVTLDIGATVALEVDDDGRGVPERREPGVGVQSMRERTEELGGVFAIGPGGAGGTRVAVAIPLLER